MRLRALATALLVAAPLVAAGLQAPATAAPTITGITPYRLIEGHSFTVTGKVPPRGRPVVLQRQVGKKWKVVDRKRTGPKGRYSFTTGRKLEGCTYADYRVVAPKHGRQHRVVKAFEERVIKPGATIVVPTAVRPGDRIAVDGYIVPGDKGRPVQLQRQQSNGSWTTVTTRKTGPLGALTFASTTVDEAVSLRIVAKAWHGLRRTVSRSATVVPHTAVTPPTQSFAQVSGDVPAGMRSTSPMADDSGRFVAFESSPVVGSTGDATDIYLVDRTAGTTTHVVSTPGHSVVLTSISGDGRYVAFNSDDPSLVSDDTNGASDVFVYDRTTAKISRQSVSSTGGQAPEAGTGVFLGTDGRFLTFRSSPTAFGSSSADPDGHFVRDQQSGTTTQVRAGRPVPGITDTARFSVETPWRDDPCDLNGETDAGVVDLSTGVIRRASPYADYGTQRNEDSVLRAQHPAMSADGRFVAFLYTRADFRTDVYLTDLRTGVIRRVYVGGDALDISADGTRVVVSSGAGSSARLVVVDWRSGRSRTLAGPLPGAHDVYGGPSLSANGRDVFFSTTRSDLVAGDTDDQADVYVTRLG